MITVGEKVLLGAMALIGALVGGASLGAAHKTASLPPPTARSVAGGQLAVPGAPFGSAPGSADPTREAVVETASQTYVVGGESSAVAQASPPNPPAATNTREPVKSRLTPQAVRQIAERCAPGAPASVLASIAKVESGDDVLTVGENGQKHLVFRPLSRQAAEALAARLIASGANVDLGLTQINSRNLGWLRLSVGEAFDPCANLAAAAKIIDRGYNAALRAGPQNRPLLQTAFSLYNTGDAERGLENGYVDKVEAARRE